MAEPDRSCEINPYAPPSVLDPPVKPDPGVGVWRDGELLVMHRAAALPPVCIKSGRPASVWVDLTVKWTDLPRLAIARLTLHVPLSERTVWVRRYASRFYLGVFSLAFALLVLLYFVYPVAFELLFLVNVLVGLVALHYALKYAQLLACCRVQRDYLWLAGAHRRFLSQLPPWPGCG